jgi:hypothetical protein
MELTSSSDFDINQNQLPRGGLIVSLGSTPGLGYAPLVGAKVSHIKWIWNYYEYNWNFS